MIKINSANPLFRMQVDFSVNELNYSLNVDVDYQNRKVIFDDPNFESDKIKKEIEEAILDYLQPQNLETPEVPIELLQKIQSLKSVNY